VDDPDIDATLDAVVDAAPPLPYEVRARLAWLLRGQHHQPPRQDNKAAWPRGGMTNEKAAATRPRPPSMGAAGAAAGSCRLCRRAGVMAGKHVAGPRDGWFQLAW
jgi:hypothetical protein